MYKKPTVLRCLAAVGAVFVMAGCSTTHHVHQFVPEPVARVRAQELEPAKPRLVSDLVRAAREAFQAANAAQEKGDRNGALEHYTKMLDLLKEANLDPGVFHSLHAEFERILESAGEPAGTPPGAYDAREVFQAANAAQEKGDREAALRHYTKMLDLLAKANPNPEAFYNVRSEFESILNKGQKQASLYDLARAREWEVRDFSDRVASDLAIESPISDRVLVEIQEIQNAYPRPFQGGLDRSYKYLPYVRAEFARAGLPTDLVWLAMVESQFSPKVVSRAGAAGLFQFMRETGGRYGLKANRYVDDRFNWQKATRAAVLYLGELYERFGESWPLAVTAYNMGEGGLERTVASTGGERNLWKLMETPPASNAMQEETKKFYAKLLASIIVAKDPERFGFKSNAQPPESTVRTPVKGSYSLAALDKASGLPEGTLRQLNPDLIRGVTPPSDEFELTVPPEAGPQLMAALESTPQVKPESLMGWVRKLTHTVKRGETVDSVARKYGVSSDEIAKANRMHTASRLTPGTRLNIPGEPMDDDGAIHEDHSVNFEKKGRAETPTSKDKAEEESKSSKKSKDKPEEKRPVKTNYTMYTIKPGDTLAAIAKAHKVSVDDLKTLNKLKKDDVIRAGETLKLASRAEMASRNEEEDLKTTHTVHAGESASKIAKLYGVNVDKLLEWNKLPRTAKINVGDKLVIQGVKGQEAEAEDAKDVPADEVKGDAKPDKPQNGPQAPKGMKKATHCAAKGESASSIAAKYGASANDFLAWNKMTAKSVLQAGAEYIVYVKGEEPKKAPEKDKKETPKMAKADAKPAKAEAQKAEPQAKAAKTDTKPAKAEAQKTEPQAKAAKADTKPAKAEAQKTEPQAKAAKTDTKPAKAEAQKTEPQAKAAKTDAGAKKPNKQEAKPKEITHVVAKGESPSSIAERYKAKVSDLCKWNGWKSNVVLQVGQKVVIKS